MKRLIFAGIVASLAQADAADRPSVSNVRLEQDTDSREVAITYDLADAPAVVLMNVATNTAAGGSGDWIDIGASNVNAAAGDVFRIVGAGKGRTIRWYPDVQWNGAAVDSVKVTLKAYPTNDPPAYMVCNLFTASRTFYESAEQLPGGIDSDDYRRHLFLMRKIPAKNVEFQMCDSADAVGFDKTMEFPHRAYFTENFYIGVFEVTHWQWEYCRKEAAVYFTENGDTRPWCDHAPADKLWKGNQEWPTNSQGVLNYDVGTVTFLAKMQKAAGLDRFLFLPTETQWEFACRAGTSTSFNNGTNLGGANESSNAGLAQVARYKGNAGIVDNGDGTKTTNGTARVGSYAPNAWGLYDMHGNVAEWVADMYNKTSVDGNKYMPADWKSGNVLTNHLGAALDELGTIRTERVPRGGHWNSAPKECRSSYRYGYYQFWRTDCHQKVGVRLAYTLKESNPDAEPANPVNDLLPYSNVDDSDGAKKNKNGFWDLTGHKGQHVSTASGVLAALVSVCGGTVAEKAGGFDSTFRSAAAASSTCTFNTYPPGMAIVIR